MMRKVVISMLLALLVSCGDEEATPVTKKSPNTPKPAASVYAKENFVEPVGGKLSLEKALLYKDLSVALVRLNDEWTQKLEKAGDNDQTILLARYEDLREELCRKMGMAGMEEYLWIEQEGLNIPINKLVVEKAGIHLGPSQSR